MKLLFLLISINCAAQNLSILDSKYGFNGFKFGLVPSQIKDIQKSDIQIDTRPNMSQYEYIGAKFKMLYEIPVADIFLFFYKNKLASIMISFRSKGEYSVNDYEKVQYSLETSFGNDWYRATNNTYAFIDGAIWKGKKITLEHIRAYASVYKIGGYINIYENNTKIQISRDEF